MEYNVEFTTTITVEANDEDEAMDKAIQEFDKNYGKSENFAIYPDEVS